MAILILLKKRQGKEGRTDRIANYIIVRFTFIFFNFEKKNFFQKSEKKIMFSKILKKNFKEKIFCLKIF